MSRRLLLGAGWCATGFGVDRGLDRSLSRNALAVWAAVATTIDYKFGLSGGSEDLDAMHRKVAERLLWVCQSNGGLYIKLGQGISALNHVLPEVYTEVLSVLQDKAECVPYAQVEQVIIQQLGAKPLELFEEFDPTPLASASIAQVHKALTKDGRVVAVKILKPHVVRQLPWDLAVYKGLVYCFEKLFDIPMYWTVDYTAEHLRRELDFELEAKNAERMSTSLSNRADCFVPAVMWEFTRKQVMTTDWVDGVKFTDLQGIKNLGLDISQVAQTMVEVFADQIFCTGYVHCDPHPGNLLVCKGPKGRHQLCVLDHGLYIEEPSEFRQQYCQLWEAMFLMDIDKLTRLCADWGIRDAEFFASLQLFRPFKSNKVQKLDGVVTQTEALDFQLAAKERVKEMLTTSELIPRPLLFVGRAMNLIRFNNKMVGGSVNRIRVFALAAARGANTRRPWTAELWFRFQLFAVGYTYRLLQFWHATKAFITSSSTNAEDTLEMQEKMLIKNQLRLRDEHKLGFKFKAEQLG